MNVNVAREPFNKTRAAYELNRSARTVERLVQDGKLPAYKRGRETVFLPEDVQRVKQELEKLIPVEAQAV